MTIEKVYDELISMIADLQKKGGGGGVSIVFVSEYTAPEPGKIYVLVGSQNNVQCVYVKNEQIVYKLYGYVPNTIHVLDDDYTDVLQAPVMMSEDGTTHVDFTNKFLQLKSGSGTFTSYFKCTKLIDAAFYDTITVEYTFQGETYSENVDISTSLLAAGDRFYLGFYYNSDNSGCRVGIAYYNELMPNNMYTHQLKTGTGSSGDIKITNFTIL